MGAGRANVFPPLREFDAVAVSVLKIIIIDALSLVMGNMYSQC